MNFGPLISPEALLEISHPVRLLDTRAGAAAFAAGHLKGALHADLERFLSTASKPGFDPARGGRHPLPHPKEWAEQLGEWGIGPDTYVVAYDSTSGGAGACRLWWMLRAFGHERVAVLDGGLPAAQKAGMEVTTERGAPPRRAGAYPCQEWKLPRTDLQTVERLLSDPKWKVLDVRSRERWRGEVEPIDPVPGRLPGSVNLPFSENLDARGRFKSVEELRALYSGLLNDVPAQNLVVYCGSGVTACHTLLALELARIPGASLYVGSYSEWCRNHPQNLGVSTK